MTANTPTSTSKRDRVHALMQRAQQDITQAFAELDGQATFRPHTWQRAEGGGGTAMVLEDGAVFDKAGVNVSAVYGKQVPPSLAKQHPQSAGQPFFATGLSMVIHTKNPYAPAFHANYRYFEVGDGTSDSNIWWFGGGADLTPNYAFEDDIHSFHSTLKSLCDRHTTADYNTFKTTCDDYFYLKHRREMRGIGGIFFDELSAVGDGDWAQDLAFVEDGLNTIVPSYLPLVARHKDDAYGERERQWQLYRRGRYVEFNLVYDRGTLFGLQTDGNIEAILMSLPPLVRWQFDYQPESGSPEAEMLSYLQPRDWC
ncbi:MAG: oxygen-dependent coproporphyrinogen oxidase [Deinococcota bacterium]